MKKAIIDAFDLVLDLFVHGGASNMIEKNQNTSLGTKEEGKKNHFVHQR